MSIFWKFQTKKKKKRKEKESKMLTSTKVHKFSRGVLCCLFGTGAGFGLLTQWLCPSPSVGDDDGGGELAREPAVKKSS